MEKEPRLVFAQVTMGSAKQVGEKFTNNHNDFIFGTGNAEFKKWLCCFQRVWDFRSNKTMAVQGCFDFLSVQGTLLGK